MDSAVTDATAAAGPVQQSKRLRVAGTVLLVLGPGFFAADQMRQRQEAAAERQQIERFQQDFASSDPAVRAEASRRFARIEIHEHSSAFLFAGLASFTAAWVLRMASMVQDAKRKW